MPEVARTSSTEGSTVTSSTENSAPSTRRMPSVRIRRTAGGSSSRWPIAVATSAHECSRSESGLGRAGWCKGRVTESGVTWGIVYQKACRGDPAKRPLLKRNGCAPYKGRPQRPPLRITGLSSASRREFRSVRLRRSVWGSARRGFRLCRAAICGALSNCFRRLPYRW